MSQLMLYEGYSTKIERTKNQKWILIHVKGKPKPLALDSGSFAGDLPHLGDKISIQANEGASWWFGQHRTLVVVRDESYFPVEGLPNYVPSRNDMVCRLIMSWLASHQHVCSDDIYDDAMKAVQGKIDPRFIGQGFRMLSKGKKIHKVGMKKSARVEKNHARDIAIWELTIKK